MTRNNRVTSDDDKQWTTIRKPTKGSWLRVKPKK